jgi:hypothetical protein
MIVEPLACPACSGSCAALGVRVSAPCAHTLGMAPLRLLLGSVLLVLGGSPAVAAPPATVVLQGADTDARRSRLVPLRVINNLGRPVSVQRAVVVERWQGSAWQVVTAVSGLLLRADCRPDPKTRVINTPALLGGCLVIGPRTTYSAPPWLGTVGDAQCVCERCVGVAPGLYRYRGRLCGKSQPILGVPFRLK